MAQSPVELSIERIGTDGAGLARHEGSLVAVPYALPGEIVRAVAEGGKQPWRLVERLSDSPDRIAPACRHFGQCGGCSLQHLATEPYRAFKRALVTDALDRVGLDSGVVLPSVTSPPGSRRRARLEATRGGVLGFRKRAGKDVVDIRECPVLHPALAQLLGPLRVLLREQQVDIALDQSEAGVDLGLTLARAPDLAQLERFAEFAETHDLARLWWHLAGSAPVLASERRKPVRRAGPMTVALPPGGFRQATAEGETALVDAVLDWIGPADRIGDLFAGSGTFTLPLAAAKAVHAVESDPASVLALEASINRARLHRVTVERRDLEARPLLPVELNRFDAVVFDPPRAGAAAQSAQLALSTVPLVLAVSCNPATFARDALTLRTGGYQLEQVLPIDQFLWSSHIELVARFRRA